MKPDLLFIGHQRIRRLLYPVVMENIIIAKPAHKPLAYCLRKVGESPVHRCPTDRSQRFKVKPVADAGTYLHHLPCIPRELSYFSGHHLNDVIGYIHRVHALDIPLPAAGFIECYHLLIVKRMQKLDYEEGISSGFFMHQICKTGAFLLRASQKIDYQIRNIFDGQRPQRNSVYLDFIILNFFKKIHNDVGFIYLIIPV